MFTRPISFNELLLYVEVNQKEISLKIVAALNDLLSNRKNNNTNNQV